MDCLVREKHERKRKEKMGNFLSTSLVGLKNEKKI